MKSTGEWGEFFPHEMSPFGYNETVAQEYFPMTEDEVRSMPKFEHWRSGEYLKDRQQATGVSNTNKDTEA